MYIIRQYDSSCGELVFSNNVYPNQKSALKDLMSHKDFNSSRSVMDDDHNLLYGIRDEYDKINRSADFKICKLTFNYDKL